MKKPGHSQHHNKTGNNPRRIHGRSDRPSAGPNRSSHASNAQAVRLWMTTPSTLTSHIPMLNKRKPDANAKKSDSNNGGAYAHKNRGKYRQPYDKSRQDMNGQPSHKNRPPAKPREPQEVHSEEAKAPMTETQTQESKALAAKIDAFEMFCAYHLGIGPNKEYKLSNINEIAKRFNMNPAMLRQVVKEMGMDATSLMDRDFDMSLAQLDIQVAPEGIDRLELAKGIYEDFLRSPVKKRDWQKIIEEDRKENMKVFGKN